MDWFHWYQILNSTARKHPGFFYVYTPLLKLQPSDHFMPLSTTLRKLPFEQFPQFSKRDISYATQAQLFKNFISASPLPSEFQAIIDTKQRQSLDRKLLATVLRDQYSKIQSFSDKYEDQINSLLSENCFTISTAHQPVLFTGPAYTIYKAISAISAAERLAKEYPDYSFLPIFIIGGEDHDFEEMNHVNLYSHRVEWNNDENGSVGRMSTKSLESTLEEMGSILKGGPHSEELIETISTAHKSHKHYAHAFQEMMVNMLGDLGILFLRMDDRRFKSAFKQVIVEELTANPSVELISKAQSELENMGYKAQAFVREINFFHLSHQGRNRIVKKGNQYSVLDTDIQWEESDLIEEVNTHPESFSPNVNMRPLFQEFILPNVAFVGGGGEISYWLERKSQFEHFKIPFPILIRRDSAIWMEARIADALNEFDITPENLGDDYDIWVRNYIDGLPSDAPELSIERAQINQYFEALQEKLSSWDVSLEKVVKGMEVKFAKDLDHLEQKILRIEKHRNEQALKKLKRIHQNIFPEEGLQERHMSFITVLNTHGKDALLALKESFDPFDPTVKLIRVN